MGGGAGQDSGVLTIGPSSPHRTKERNSRGLAML